MHQHLAPASSLRSPQIEENRILAEIEKVVCETMMSNEAASTESAPAAGRRRYSLLLVSALVLAAALMPDGPKASDLLALVTP